MSPARSGLPVLGVVVPVHDEQELLARCLRALGGAAGRLDGRAEVRTVVVLDDCVDDSERIAAGTGVERVMVGARRVGTARRVGCATLVAPGRPGGPSPADWLVTTDADSTVPPTWLRAHLDALLDGYDALVGTVAVDDFSAHPERVQRWFRDVYDRSGDPHPHVHGANLGVRAEAYRAVGGFSSLRTGEDVALVAALSAHGYRVHRSRASPVVTSARLSGRALHGFAGHLHLIAREETTPLPPVA